MQRLTRFIFCNLWGWKIQGNFPAIKKYMVVAMPHTSNWDFFIGLFLRPILNVDIKFAGKSSLFIFPLGYLFRWLGGYPVDRSKNTNFVKAVVDIYNSKDRFALCIAPEGTRKSVDKIKTGFYYIAKEANIPVVMIKFDWGNSLVDILEPYYLSDNMEADMEHIKQQFRGVRGKNRAFEL
jgi:1-acyl-sn-glycerol-3-phosphate acyltransferase